MKKDIYRKAALERIATVDQLDKALKITSPLSWLALLGVTLMIAVAVVWSFIGTLPSTVTASGTIANVNTSTNTYLAQANGTVELLVSEGSPIDIGTEVVRLTQSGASTTFASDQRGYVASILTNDGTTVSTGTELFRIRPYVTAGQQQVAVCYVAVKDADKIKRGMQANISLTSASSSTYGHMEGRVINVDSWATSTKGIEAVVGTDNSMASSFTKDGSVCAVTCEIYPIDSETAQSRNGYYWSNEKGRELEISDRMMCSVKIITENVHPITKLFAKLKDVLGD